MSEEALIRRLLAHHPSGAVRVGPGDDAAVVEVSGPLVVTTDSLVEDIHFRRGWLSPADLAWRLVRVNLSDLAAMGAQPHAALLSLVGSDDDFPEEFAAGLGAACADAGLALVGGNVSASPGPMRLTMTCTGVARTPLLRSGASAGDGVWVSGPLGLAGAGLAALLAGRPHADPEAVAAWRRPPNRVGVGRALVGRASACMDISDGLAADLPRMCAASGVGATVSVDAVPGRPATRLGAGEDYELLVTAAADVDLGDLGLTRIGRMQAGRALRFVDAAGRSVEPGPPFDHLGASE